MIRRLLNLAAVVSLLLCIGTCVLWVRSERLREGWEFWTHSGSCWQFASNDSFCLIHVSNWPEPSGTKHIIYDESRDTMTEHAFTLPLSGSTKKVNFGGIHIVHGTECLAVKSNGVILRMPPVPADYRRYLSTPLPFWSVSLPHWLLATAFAILPAMLSYRQGRRWIKGRLRRKRMLCESAAMIFAPRPVVARNAEPCQPKN